MQLATKIVEWNVLRDIVAGALLSGVGVTTLFAFAIVGASGFSQARREGRGGSAVVYGVFTALCLAAFFGGVVFAITVITNKG